MVRIDPLNKCFMIVFWLVILSVIGFFIASIFMKTSDEGSEVSDSVVKIKFASSNAEVKLKSYVSNDDGHADETERYVLELYSGECV